MHRFTDPSYAQLSLRMRTGDDPGAVFDQLAARGQIVVHASEVERVAALASLGATTRDLVIADTRDQVAHLNAAIREQRQSVGAVRKSAGSSSTVTTARGEVVGLGDRVATRRNDPDLGVANRQTWTVTAIGDDGGLILHGHAHGHGHGHGNGRDRVVPAEYAARFVELAYATTVHGAQGETVDRAHVLIGEVTGAAAAYVAMTRGRENNTAHLVAETLEEARRQWIDTFGRDRADLGPAHARGLAADAIDRYGPNAPRRPRTHLGASPGTQPGPHPEPPSYQRPTEQSAPSLGF